MAERPPLHNLDVSQPYRETNHAEPDLLDDLVEGPAGSRIGHHAEDEPDLEGYDETQRAEVAEVEGDGPSDGVVMTDLAPDMGEDLDEDEVEDDEDLPDTVIDTDSGIIR